MKTCFKCGVEKDLESFYKHPRMADGRLGKCKECAKKDVFENRQRNKPHYDAYERRRAVLPERRAEFFRRMKERMEKHPERAKATQMVNKAVRDKKILKYPCFICGDRRSVGHHPDYSDPLSVVWLCNSHHMQLHSQHRAYLKTLSKTKE